MSTAVIGATGRVGSEIVRGALARGNAVAALVRDPDKARRTFGEPDGLRIRPTRLDDAHDLTEAFDGISTVFIAMGSIGIEGVLQRIAINAAAGISAIEQVTRLSVLNASLDSRGINQRAHYSIDQFASSTAVPYSTIRPSIFSASLLSAAPEVRTCPTCQAPLEPEQDWCLNCGEAQSSRRVGRRFGRLLTGLGVGISQQERHEQSFTIPCGTIISTCDPLAEAYTEII